MLLLTSFLPQPIVGKLARFQQLFFRLGILQDIGESIDILRAQYDVYVRRPAKNQLLVLLRHTAGNNDKGIRIMIFDMLQGANMSPDATFGAFAHAAGVNHDNVGAAVLIAVDVAHTFQLAGNSFRVALVHLTAKTFNKIGVSFHKRSFPFELLDTNELYRNSSGRAHTVNMWNQGLDSFFAFAGKIIRILE